MSENIDLVIEQLLNVIKEKREEISKTKETIKQPWKTNGIININQEWIVTTISNKQLKNENRNLQTSSIETIKTFIINLIQEQKYRKEAEELLGLDITHLFNGYIFEDWIEDCKKRINIIQLRDKESRLLELESNLNSLVSDEQRRKIEVENIKKAMDAF